MGFDITGLGSVFDFAKGVMDKIWPPAADPNAKLQAQMALQEMLEKRENNLVQAQKEIIVAEMQQTDPFTKRARPMLVYAGLFFIFMIHVAFPMITWFTKQQLPALTLPDDFWWAWGSVVGIWSIGRSAEKFGTKNPVITAITGGK
jgi:hypothetical protein